MCISPTDKNPKTTRVECYSALRVATLSQFLTLSCWWTMALPIWAWNEI